MSNDNHPIAPLREYPVYTIDALIQKILDDEKQYDLSKIVSAYETAEHYHSLLFNRSTSRLFSEEILSTVEMFFRKDLNLSDTARQLYIHRNTLVYRLDKVQRQIGLDLRKFDDAVTFKMLMEMKKCTANKTKITL